MTGKATSVASVLCVCRLISPCNAVTVRMVFTVSNPEHRQNQRCVSTYSEEILLFFSYFYDIPISLPPQTKLNRRSTAKQYRNHLNPNLCMDLKHGKAQNKNPVWLYPCHGGQTQSWILDSYGRLRSQVDENYCVEGGQSVQEYDPLFVWKCHDDEHQRWTVEDDGRIKNKGHGFYIGVSDGCKGVASGKALQLHTNMSTNDRSNCRDQQRWKTNIVSKIPGCSGTPSRGVNYCAAGEKDYPKGSVSQMSGERFIVMAATANGLAISIENGYPMCENFRKIVLANRVENDRQKWFFRDDGRIESALCGGYFLTAGGCVHDSDAKENEIILRQQVGDNNKARPQRWKYEPIDLQTGEGGRLKSLVCPPRDGSDVVIGTQGGDGTDGSLDDGAHIEVFWDKNAHWQTFTFRNGEPLQVGAQVQILVRLVIHAMLIKRPTLFIRGVRDTAKKTSETVLGSSSSINVLAVSHPFCCRDCASNQCKKGTTSGLHGCSGAVTTAINRCIDSNYTLWMENQSPSKEHKRSVRYKCSEKRYNIGITDKVDDGCSEDEDDSTFRVQAHDGEISPALIPGDWTDGHRELGTLLETAKPFIFPHFFFCSNYSSDYSSDSPEGSFAYLHRRGLGSDAQLFEH